MTQVRRTVEHLRRLESTTRTPVMVAASGRRSLALAGEVADIITLAHSPFASPDDVKRMLAHTTEAAGERADEIEYCMNVLVVGDAIPHPIAALVGNDIRALTEAGSHQLLRGTPRRMADEIERRRDAFGYSYVVVNALYLEQFAPVVELLNDR